MLSYLTLIVIAAMLISTNIVQLLGFILISGPWFFLPTIVAFCLHNPRLPQLAIMNFFLGATIVGWVLALLLAITHVRED